MPPITFQEKQTLQFSNIFVPIHHGRTCTSGTVWPKASTLELCFVPFNNIFFQKLNRFYCDISNTVWVEIICRRITCKRFSFWSSHENYMNFWEDFVINLCNVSLLPRQWLHFPNQTYLRHCPRVTTLQYKTAKNNRFK